MYFDAAMSGWLVESNTFENCMLGVFVNGGCDNIVRGNHFSDTDHAIYMGGDSCYNPLGLAFGNLKNVSKLLAWQRQYDVSTIMK